MSLPTVTDARIRARRGGREWQVRVPRLAVLRALVMESVGSPAVESLELEVASWRPPVAGWFGRPGISGLSVVELSAKDEGARVVLSCVTPTDPGVLLAAALRCLQSVPSGDARPQLTFLPGASAASSVLAAEVRDVVLVDEKRDRHVRRADDLIAATDGEDVVANRRFVINEAGWSLDGEELPVYVDPAVHRPMGRRSVDGTSVAAGRFAGDALVVTVDSGELSLRADLTAAQVRALRGVGAIEFEGLISERLAAQLNACGVQLGAAGTTWPAVDDYLGWQSLSVSGRRHALRAHSPAMAFGSWPSVSVVVATHRNDHLSHVFDQLAQLRYPRLEVVIGAHGSSIDVEYARQRASMLPYPARVINVDASATLGEVLQACCDAADGSLVTKMDDDDFYSAEHVWDLVLARMYSGAQVVGKTLDWVRLAAMNTTVLRPTYGAEKYADFVAGGTMLISKADLLAVGGWRPVPKSVDRALLDRVLESGGLVYRTHGLGYVYVRRSDGHTASVSDEHFLTKTTATFEGLPSHPELGTA